MSPRFRNPAPVSKEDAEALFSRGDTREIPECLVALAFYEPDAEFVWRALRRFVDSQDPGVRGIAILCIGHMARIHGWIPAGWADARVNEALTDADEFVRGHGHSAASDIKMFAQRRLDPEHAHAVSREWELMLAHEDEGFRAIVVMAAREPRLRALFPFRSLNNLRFSLTTEYPYSMDLPYIVTTPYGEHQARARDGRLLFAGDLDEVVRRVAAEVAHGRGRLGFNVTHPFGDMESNYPVSSFGLLLDELEDADEEHGDIAVTHESEWCLMVGRGSFATLELLTENNPVHLGPLDRDALLSLMKEVAEGRSEELLRVYPWQPGYPR